MSDSLPASLRPTERQLSVAHDYGIDLLPSSSLRNRLINAGQVAPSFLAEIGIHGPDEGQVLIWGDPLNELSWEFSASILERWTWLIGSEWVERANFWRQQRGAPRLSQPPGLDQGW